MQKKKNIRLLIIFSALLLWTIFFANLEKGSSKIAVDETLFAIADTASISEIIIKKPGELIKLSKNQSRWEVNDKYRLDLSMKKVLMAVLHAVRIQRSVPKKNQSKVLEELQNNGIEIKIVFQNGDSEQYIAGGNGISVSYFTKDFKNMYVVNLPGYESYVTGIFEVSENDWRDRLVYQTSWLGLKKLSIMYNDPAKPDLLIEPEGDLYKVEGTNNADTSKIMTFIDQQSFFYVDHYLNLGEIPVYDSLINTKPFAHLLVDAVGFGEPVKILFFKALPNENVMLGIINDQQLGLFQKDRMNDLFKTIKDFEK